MGSGGRGGGRVHSSGLGCGVLARAGGACPLACGSGGCTPGGGQKDRRGAEYIYKKERIRPVMIGPEPAVFCRGGVVVAMSEVGRRGSRGGWGAVGGAGQTREIRKKLVSVVFVRSGAVIVFVRKRPGSRGFWLVCVGPRVGGGRGWEGWGRGVGARWWACPGDAAWEFAVYWFYIFFFFVFVFSLVFYFECGFGGR